MAEDVTALLAAAEGEWKTPSVDEKINYGGLIADPIFSRIVSRYYPVKVNSP